MESYILRIYRRERKGPRRLVGVVEDVEVDTRKPFKTIDELWQILRSPKNRSPEESAGGSGGRRRKPRVRWRGTP